MRTFTQKPAKHRPASSEAQTSVATRRSAHPAEHLQRAIGNQAVQRLLGAHPALFGENVSESETSVLPHNAVPAVPPNPLAPLPQPVVTNVTPSPLRVARKDGPDPAKTASADTPDNSYWFQQSAPQKTVKTADGIEIEPKGQVQKDPRSYKLDSKDPTIGAIEVQFAGMQNDFSDEKPNAQMAQAEQLVLAAIGGVMKDLLELPAVSGTPKEVSEKRKADLALRARLKEPLRTLNKKTLNIFIASDLTVAEKMSLAPLTLKTEQIFVNANDIGDKSKLQAAIRIPLVVLLGGEVGIASNAKALTEAQSKEALLHELTHVFLINRNASANQLWQGVGVNLVKGPKEAKEAAEDVMRRYLRAQEELFVYTQVGQLYSEFAKNKTHYEKFVQAVELFLSALSAQPDQTKTIKLDVNEKVQGKKP